MNDFLVSKPTFELAEKLSNQAMEEHARPEEDVVPFMVCDSAYKAVIQYLKGYIQSYGREPFETDSPEVLLEECRIINPAFYELNIKIFNQKDKNDDVLMDMHMVNSYMQILQMTKSLVGAR